MCVLLGRGTGREGREARRATLLSAIKTFAYNKTLGPLCWLNYGCIFNRGLSLSLSLGTHTIHRLLAEADVERGEQGAQRRGGQGGVANKLAAQLGKRPASQQLMQSELLQQQLQQRMRSDYYAAYTQH